MGKLLITSVDVANNFKEKDIDILLGIARNMVIDDPKTWWAFNDVYNNKPTEVQLTLENVKKNSSQIEKWVNETVDYTVIAYSHIVTDETKTEKSIIKQQWFGADKEEKETVIRREKYVMWSFYFKEESDAVLFSTTWKGAETK